MAKIVDLFNEAFPLEKIAIRTNQINRVNLTVQTQQLRYSLYDFR